MDVQRLIELLLIILFLFCCRTFFSLIHDQIQLKIAHILHLCFHFDEKKQQSSPLIARQLTFIKFPVFMCEMNEIEFACVCEDIVTIYVSLNVKNK